jgi:hypothetical protein
MPKEGNRGRAARAEPGDLAIGTWKMGEGVVLHTTVDRIARTRAGILLIDETLHQWGAGRHQRHTRSCCKFRGSCYVGGGLLWS